PAGPVGATGATGATGLQGPTGPAGPAGADGSANAWGLSGTAATSGHFLGTTNNQPLQFKVNNVLAGYLRVGSSTSFGTQAMQITGVNDVTAIGYNSLHSSSGLRNTAVGAQAMAANTVGQECVAVGAYALQTGTAGVAN